MIIPHIQVSSNFALMIMLLCGSSMAAQVVGTVFIFFLYHWRGIRIGNLVGKFPFLHIMYFAVAYGLAVCVLVATLFWDLYHNDISCWCFPLVIRIALTIPIVIFGDLAVWKMLRHQGPAAVNDPIR